MKSRLLFAWLLLATCVSAQAQTSELEYRPFVQAGKTFKTCGIIKEDTYINTIEGDTLINGETWKKVYNSRPWRGEGRLVHSYYAAIREEGKKVYAIAKGSNRPRLLYDFGLKENDVIKCGIEGNAFGCLLDEGEKLDTLLGFPFKAYLLVDTIDTVRLQDGMEYRRFSLIMLDAFRAIPITEHIVWIEGLGSGGGPFAPWLTRYHLYADGDEEMPLYRTEYYINNQFIESSANFYGTDTPSAVSSPQPARWNGNIYDLDGRVLPSRPAQGIYIEDGKKVAVK